MWFPIQLTDPTHASHDSRTPYQNKQEKNKTAKTMNAELIASALKLRQ
jgi:hypothetical protein